MARGLNNKNPLNIRHNADVFQGEIRPSTDKAFKQFESIGYGFRAAFVTLGTYLMRDRRDTVEKIVSAWAPPSENDTEAYIKAVVRLSGVPRDKVLTQYDGESYIKIVAAMSQQENGVAADMSAVNAGFEMQSKIKI